MDGAATPPAFPTVSIALRNPVHDTNGFLESGVTLGVIEHMVNGAKPLSRGSDVSNALDLELDDPYSSLYAVLEIKLKYRAAVSKIIRELADSPKSLLSQPGHRMTYYNTGDLS